MDAQPSLGIYLDYVIMTALRRVWSQAQLKMNMTEEELRQVWQTRIFVMIASAAIGLPWVVATFW